MYVRFLVCLYTCLYNEQKFFQDIAVKFGYGHVISKIGIMYIYT